MTQILKLFKLQFDEKFDVLKTGNKKIMFGSILKYLLIIVALTAVCYVVFLRFVVLGFATSKQLISIILLVTQIISLVFSVGHIIKVLFQNKDNELLMSLPVNPNHVFVSKLLLLYTQEIIVNACIMLPLLISIGMLGHYSIFFFVMLPVITLILPLLPMSFALLISIPSLYIIKFFKRHSILSTIFILGFVVSAVIVYANVLSSFAEQFNIVSKQIETVMRINRGISDFGNANIFYLILAEGILYPAKSYYILLFIVSSIVLFVIAYFIIKPFFFNIAMSNLENSTEVYKEGEFRQKSKFRSLLHNEFLNVFRSSGFIFEYFLFVFLMPFVVVVYDNMLLGLVVNQSGEQMINGSHLLIVAVFSTLANIYSASAVSREGQNFYIVKSTPVDYYRQSIAKLVFNGIFSVGAIVITGIVSLFYMEAWVAILTTLICIFLSLGHMFYSFDNDLRQPTLDWYDSGEIAKVNKNTTKSIVMGLILSLVAGMFVIFVATAMNVWAYIILLFACIAYCLYKAYVLTLRIFYQYERLEP